MQHQSVGSITAPKNLFSSLHVGKQNVADSADLITLPLGVVSDGPPAHEPLAIRAYLSQKSFFILHSEHPCVRRVVDSSVVQSTRR